MVSVGLLCLFFSEQQTEKLSNDFFFLYLLIHSCTVHCKNNHSVVLLVKILLPLSVRSCLIKFMEAACIHPHSCRMENCTEHKDALAGFSRVISRVISLLTESAVIHRSFLTTTRTSMP